MKLYKGEKEIYAEKDQLNLLLADGWSKEKSSVNNEVTGKVEVAGDLDIVETPGDNNPGDETSGDESTGDETSGDENTGDENTADLEGQKAPPKVTRKISRSKKD